MKKFFKFMISFIISIVLLYFLLKEFNINELVSALEKTNLFLVLGSFLLYIILILIRTLRFRTLLKKSLPLRELFPIVCKHTFLKVIVPFKIGELSFIYFLKKKNHGVGKSFSSLIVARIFDFSIIIGVFVLVIVFSANNIKELSNLVPYSIMVFLILIVSLLFLLISPDFLIKLFKKIKPNKINKLISPFKELKSKHIMTKTLIFSLSHYVVSILSTYLILYATGFSLPVNIFIITITLSTLSGFLPVNGIAGLGTVETVIALVLSYFGYSATESIILGFSIHIIQILFVVLVGIIGWSFPSYHHKIRS